ncbi:hypothetical protein Tco_0012755 [Tanacetum coccineum]
MRIRIRSPIYANLKTSSEEKQDVRTPSPPPRDKSLLPPQLRFSIPKKFKPQELPQETSSSHNDYLSNMDDFPLGTDKAKIARKRSKPDKHGHENGRARKELEVFYKKIKKSAVVNPQSTLGQSHNKTKPIKFPNQPSR